MRKAARLLIVALPLFQIVALLGCVSNAPATKISGTWIAVNPRSANFTYTLVSQKGELTLTAKNALDGGTVGSIKIAVKSSDDKTGRISGPIQSSNGIYKDLTGTAYLNIAFNDLSQKGPSVVYLAISATSFPDFSPQLAFVKQEKP
jgi:hypothetical protein